VKRFEHNFRQDRAALESTSGLSGLSGVPELSGTLDEVFVPAFLNHVTELAMSLQAGHSSAIVNISTNNNTDTDSNADADSNNDKVSIMLSNFFVCH
jgi:hypothetical protein